MMSTLGWLAMQKLLEDRPVSIQKAQRVCVQGLNVLSSDAWRRDAIMLPFSNQNALRCSD